MFSKIGNTWGGVGVEGRSALTIATAHLSADSESPPDCKGSRKLSRLNFCILNWTFCLSDFPSKILCEGFFKKLVCSSKHAHKEWQCRRSSTTYYGKDSNLFFRQVGLVYTRTWVTHPVQVFTESEPSIFFFPAKIDKVHFHLSPSIFPRATESTHDVTGHILSIPPLNATFYFSRSFRPPLLRSNKNT